MKINKLHVKVASKLFGRNNLKELAKLSEKEIFDKVRANPKAKDISDDMIKLMYNEVIKRV